jgi:hypothetical protein
MNYGAPGEIIRAARSPLRGRPSGDRHRRCAALSSNSLVVCREFESLRRAASNDEGFSVKESDGAPGGIRTPGLLVRSQALYPAELRAQRKTVVLLEI